jgi:hypothetical protein
MTPYFWNSFRDELIITAVVLSLTAGTTFFYVYQSNRPLASVKIDQEKLKTLGATTEGDTEVTEPAGSAVATPPETSPTPSATPNPLIAEVPYGEGKEYSTAAYIWTVSQPKLSFNSETNTSRRLTVEMVIANKNFQAGISNRVYATVVKDGAVIVPQAAMSVSESKMIFPGQQLTFTATLGLIEGTDVSQIIYKPGGVLSDSIHPLTPGVVAP